MQQTKGTRSEEEKNILMIANAVFNETGLLHEQTEVDSILTRFSCAAGDHPLDCF